MEELRDLLDLDTSPKDLHVREDSKGNTGIILDLKGNTDLGYKGNIGIIPVLQGNTGIIPVL